MWRKPVLLSAEMPRPTPAEACPRSSAELAGLLGRRALKAVPAGDWMFVYPSAWHTRTLLPREIFANPMWTEPKLDFRVSSLMIDGHREIASDELTSIAAAVRLAARPPLVDPAPLGTEGGKPVDTIRLGVSVDIFRSRASTDESVVAAYQHGALARIVYGELREGRYVPLWDSPLFSASLIDYYDLDDDGVPEITLRGRLGQDGWLFTAFNLRGDEMTRQSYCEPWHHSMGTRASYSRGGFVCPITGHRDGDIEYVEGPNGTVDLEGNVWSQTPKGLQRGPVRFRLVNGRYVRAG
ncbi:MAG TPA: hypothetical protein VGQ37_07530 [Vicinamibacterales bacterium]|nr:hypothetical protein [Vicinamibacterales bacterium]